MERIMRLDVENKEAKNMETKEDKNVERDKALYKEFLDGNAEALTKLIKAYRNEIIYFIHTFVKDYHAAEDISHETFIYLLMHKEVYDFKYTFRTYLYMIAKSRALNYIKSRKKFVFIDEQVDPMYSEFEEVEEEVFRLIDDERIKEVMCKLKKEYRMVMYLIEMKELSYKEAGLIMNKNLSQIKQLVFNAKKRLKKLIEEENLNSIK